MSEKGEVKTEALPDLDDLLQCPVCYEIPSGQIFQCNEGHHVCGRCKMRLDVCPVCRALFFGTRNYAMEELISNVKKLRAFKLGGKVTTGSTSETSTPANDETAPEIEQEDVGDDEENNLNFASRPAFRAPQACKGLFRCLCCKTGNAERLPSARLLNHLRYFHAPELIEGKSENGEYLQAWQFSTVPGRIVTAVRIADMGIFFLIIEISNDSVCSWLTMASSPWVAHEFCYTVTISGNDREAIFSDCVWSVRSCEGSLKKRGHCLVVNGMDARALVAPATISGKLSVKRVPSDQLTQQTQPRAVLRVASRGNPRDVPGLPRPAPAAHNIEPFLQDLQNDVARLSRAFATLGREANALVRSEEMMRTRNQVNQGSAPATLPVAAPPAPAPAQHASAPVPPVPPPEIPAGLSRNARRRMRQRVRAALNASQPPPPPAEPQSQPQPPSPATSQPPCPATSQPPRPATSQPPRPATSQPLRPATSQPPRPANSQPPRPANSQPPAPTLWQQMRPGLSQPPRAAPPVFPQQRPRATFSEPILTGLAIVQPSPPPAPAPTPSAGPSNEQQNGNPSRANKKKRRQRR